MALQADDNAGDGADSGAVGDETIELIVPPAPSPARLDAWLAGTLADRDLSRSRLKALIEAGNVALDGAPGADAKRKLRGGERVLVRVPPPEPAAPEAEAIPLAILHEDDDLIVLSKPVGMVVHPGAGVRSGTLVNALLHHAAGSLSGIGGVARPGIVHRLDRDTSGVMVVAKTDWAHRALSAQFADHGRTGPLERAYVALVWGEPTPPAGVIDAPLRRDPRDRTRRAVGDGSDARHAVTHYRTLEPMGATACVQCRLETGRTHQIRVHMAHIGHPLLGDDVYGAGYRSKSAKLGAEAQAALAAMRGQALHARSLAFAHPATRETMRFEAPPPPEMLRLQEALRGNC